MAKAKKAATPKEDTRTALDETNSTKAARTKATKVKAAREVKEAEPLDHNPETANAPLPDVITTASGKQLKLPKAKGTVSLGKVVDMLYARREREKEIKAAIDKQFGKELAKLDDEEKAVADYLINSIPKSHATGIAGQNCRVSVVTKEVLQAEDWDAIQKYILKTKDFSIIGRSLKQDVLQEYADAGKKVPGIKVFNAVKLSVTKL